MAILEVNTLSAGYENGFVIANISFSIEEGEFVAILGRNGSGKSTLIKALQNLLKNTSGKVEIFGQDLFSLSSSDVSQKIAYVPQMSDISFDFSVGEIVAMGRYVHQGRFGKMSQNDTRVIEEVMSLTEISHLKEKKMAHLSGGERQRVYIARALAQDTPFLFLDEPSSHLDISYQIEIYRILKRLQEEKKKTILTTEHNINLAIPYSHRLMLLKEGKIHALGHPEELVTRTHIKEVFHADVDIRKNTRSGLPEISLIPKVSSKT